jgi:hypothetical protein
LSSPAGAQVRDEHEQKAGEQQLGQAVIVDRGQQRDVLGQQARERRAGQRRAPRRAA